MKLHDKNGNGTISYSREFWAVVEDCINFRKYIGMYLNIHERIKIRHTFPKESDENAPYDELDINELAVWVARTWAFLQKTSTMHADENFFFTKNYAIL